MNFSEHQQIQEALRTSEEKYRALFDLFSQGFCICEMLIDENNIPYDYRFLEVNQLFEEHTGLVNATGKTALELLPNLEPYWVETYGKVALTGEALRFEQGSAVMGRWFDVYAFRFGQPEHHQFAIVFNDISERKRAEERGEVLQTLASALSNSISWQEVIDNILQKGMSQVGANGGLVTILSDDKAHLELITSLGYAPDIVAKWKRFPLDHPTAPSAFAIRENKQLWIASPEEHNLVLPLKLHLTNTETHAAWATIPFNINNELIGALGLGFSTPQKFDISQQTFLITLTEYCAQALHRANLTEQIGPLAAAKERQRLSRDLHDSVKQLLFASSLIAEGLPRMWEKTPEKARKHTDDIVKLNRASLAELQSLLLEMRPQAIVTTPFIALIKNLCTGLRGHKTITINVNYEGPDELYLPVDTHIALYRLTQETLNNVNKHSGATQLDIDCRYVNNVFHLRIQDNGKGFDLHHTPIGFGMNTMRERAQMVGATFDIKSSPDAGTEIKVEWHSKETPLTPA